MKKGILLLLISLMYHLATAQIPQLQKLSQINFNTTCAGVWHYVDSVGNEYALLGNGDGLVIVNVTDPVNPAVLFTVPANTSLWREVKTYGHYAYAGTEGGGGITIVDLSGLPNSYNSKIYDGDGAIAGQIGSSHTVQVFGEYLYIFGSNIGVGGAIMCSLADPWNPAYVGIYDANYVHDGYVLNDTLYSAEIYAGQFSVVDVTDKSNPTVLAIQPTPGAFNHNTWFSDNNQFLYTTDELPNTPVGVFDVTDLQDIKLVETYVNDSLPDEEVHNVRVFNDFLLCPSYGSQLTIVDGARPDNLIEIARHATGSYLCWDASPYLPSGNIIATDMDGIFYVFAPYYVRACYLEGNVTDQTTGLPIDGAQAQILSTTAFANSNIVGDYKTGNATAGTFDVQFSKPGYITKVINGVVLTNGVLTTLDVQLESLVVNIEVTDFNTGLPVPFAKIKIEGGSTNLQYTTDINGTLTLSTLSSGNFDITAGLWGYKSNCVSVNTGTPGTISIVITPGIYDDFTFDYLWTVSSTATTGAWVRDEPVGTVFSTSQANPDLDVTNDCSVQCFVTGNGGGGANDDDVDNGTTTLTSPTFNLSGYNDPYVNYLTWFFQAFTSNPSINDTMFVFLNNGTVTTQIDLITGNLPTNSTWLAKSLRVLDFITPTSTMNLIVSITDKPGTGNPLEGGFDRFEVSEGPVSANEIPASQAGFVVYPNPFKSDFEIELYDITLAPNSTLTVTDITGRTVVTQKISSTEKISISSSNWESGTYFITITNGTQNLKVKKVVKI